MRLAKNKIKSFQNFVWDFYKNHGRLFSWRNVDSAYKVLISEIMLQQTQTHRVEKKYDTFIMVLPNFKALASVPLKKILHLWQGLGYNRRALYLQQIAKKVIGECNGEFPMDVTILATFPGIGKATAASICAFAYNMPTIFIETNIRTVFIYSFFPQQEGIKDNDILVLVEQTLDRSNPREWYYALMDYGVTLKKMHPNLSKKSAHYTKQSKFEGSDRQIRGNILKILIEHGKISKNRLTILLNNDVARIEHILQKLCNEGLVLQDTNQQFLIK